MCRQSELSRLLSIINTKGAPDIEAFTSNGYSVVDAISTPMSSTHWITSVYNRVCDKYGNMPIDIATSAGDSLRTIHVLKRNSRSDICNNAYLAVYSDK